MQESIDAKEFLLIQQELERRPIPSNQYRLNSGIGRSQAFGLVNRRSMPPDYSRMCWQRTYLYKLLLDFAEKHVKVPFTSITVNQNYQVSRHRDHGNTGKSFLVAFGDYEDGELVIEDGPNAGTHNIKNTPIIADFNEAWHSVKPFTGNRYSLVFYTLDPKGRGSIDNIPQPSVRFENDRWVFYRGEEQIGKGLAHPLRGRVKPKKKDRPVASFTRTEGEVTITLD